MNNKSDNRESKLSPEAQEKLRQSRDWHAKWQFRFSILILVLIIITWIFK